jgi:outer membrane biosynthesis protein TonB
MMKTIKSLAIVFCVGLFLLASSMQADIWNKRTIFTFSGPVKVADTQLSAGTYVFKLMDSDSNRHIVQIFNADETQLISTIMAIPDYRLTPTGDTVIKFSESSDQSQASGTLPESGIPIKEWFFAGDTAGVEFPVAPTQVAEVQPEPAAAPAAAAPAPEPPAEPPAAAAPTPATAAPPAEDAPAQDAAPAPSPQTEQTPPTPEQPAAPEQLPQTASQMPLVGLIGVISLAVAACLRIFLKISA